ncbi:unnamed protein product, partial [Tetraodon nigroviridis]
FLLAAVSPAVLVPSMLLLQAQGLGVAKGIPTLLMAAGSLDDVLAIAGFSACLGSSFSTGPTWMSVLRGLMEVGGGVLAGLLLGLLLCCLPSQEQVSPAGPADLDQTWTPVSCGLQEDLVLRRTLLLLGLSVFAVFFSHVMGVAGAGGLCALVLAFVAALGWRAEKVWAGLLDLPVHVQAAIGSKALDMAREEGDGTKEGFGLVLLTLAVLAILITAPMGALAIGLAGPRLLPRPLK